MTQIAQNNVRPASSFETSDGLRAWAYRPGWAQVSLLVLLATPAFVLGTVSGGIYGATLCSMVWLALRLADEDAAWAERDARDPETEPHQ
ncbi:MAG: hypothetical protein KDK70_44215 [Myxococcales bacterium]|nr:hypothetical protein [Myxococcales bacterium]